MNLFVISDTHIQGPTDPLFESVLRLIQYKAQSGDIVVFAGDLFDLFVGNKALFFERYQRFMEALIDAGSRGVCFHYIEGNHDFYMKKVASKVSALKTHSHHLRLEIKGKKLFIAHGDTIDKKDYSYRLLRALIRNPIAWVVIRALPGKWIDFIGNKASASSRQKRARLPVDLPAQRLIEVRKIFRNFAAEKLAEGFDYVVLGHCHDLDEMHFQIGDKTGQYINVGFPRMHGSFLSWSPDSEKFEREKLPS